jgi:hypothetical protein
MAKHPVLLREGPMSGEVHAIRRYTRKQVRGQEVINAIDKDVVTSDFEHVMLARLFGDDTGMQPLLGKAMDAAYGAGGITKEENNRIVEFLARLEDAINRTNASGDGDET